MTEEEELVPRGNVNGAGTTANPFIQRGPVRDGAQFFGRTEETGYLLDLVRGTQSCSVTGQRRIGKTSLLYHIADPEVLNAHGLSPSEYLFVHVDLEGLVSITQKEFFRLMLEEAAERAAGLGDIPGVDRLLEREEISFLDLRSGIKALCGAGLKLVFLLDEFELFCENKGLDPNFFSGLRNLATNHDVCFVTTSVETLFRLTFTNEVLSSPFFNFFSVLHLGHFDEKEARDMVRGLAEFPGIFFPEGGYEAAHELGGRYPFFLRMACAHLCREGGSGGAKRDALVRARAGFMEEAGPHFQYFWDHLEGAERAALSGLASGKPPAGDGKVLESLRAKGLVAESEGTHVPFSGAFSEFIASRPAEAPARARAKATSPEATGRPEYMQGEAWDGYSTKQKIMALLGEFGTPGRFERYRSDGEVPHTLTQSGIAEALGKRPSEVQTALKGPYSSLTSEGLVREVPKKEMMLEDVRVRGGKYRYQLVYVLTESGEEEAVRLKERLN